MTVSAVVEGFEVEDGDVLIAYADGEEVGATPLSSPEGDTDTPLFYLSICGHEAPTGAAGGSLWFAIERDGDIIASTSETMLFQTNAVIGSPDEPTAISFVHTAYENGKWYSIDGMQLPKKPAKKGIYIFNNKKVMIK